MEYVTIEEVKRICKELNIRDWTTLEESKVLPEEAEAILNVVNTQEMKITVDDFRQGLDVELEHGMKFKDVNVTNNHPILTGKIVMAHFKESLDYYKRLDVAEIEGDLLKAVISKNSTKVEALYRKLLKARELLSHAEIEQLE